MQKVWFMEQVEKVDIKFSFKTIDIIEFSLNPPPQTLSTSGNFSFNMDIKQEIDEEHKLCR